MPNPNPRVMAETVLIKSTAAAYLTARGITTSPRTIIDWWDRGVAGIVLESYLIGGRRFTSVEALERFFARRNGEPERKPIPVELVERLEQKMFPVLDPPKIYRYESPEAEEAELRSMLARKPGRPRKTS